MSLQKWMNFHPKSGQCKCGNRTIFNRVGYLDTFLRASGVPKLLENREWPRFTEKVVKAYSHEELFRLLAAANAEDRIALKFSRDRMP